MLYHTISPVIQVINIYACGGRLKSLRSFWRLQTAFASDGGSRAATACLRLSLRSSVTVGIACAFPWCSAHIGVRLPPSPPTKKKTANRRSISLFTPNKKANTNSCLFTCIQRICYFFICTN